MLMSVYFLVVQLVLFEEEGLIICLTILHDGP